MTIKRLRYSPSQYTDGNLEGRFQFFLNFSPLTANFSHPSGTAPFPRMTRWRGTPGCESPEAAIESLAHHRSAQIGFDWRCLLQRE